MTLSLQQGESEPLNFVLNILPEEMMSTADQILALTENVNLESELEDILRTLVLSRLGVVNQRLDYLRYAQEDLQAQGDLKASEYQSTMIQYAELLNRLHTAQNTYTNRSLATKGRPTT